LFAIHAKYSNEESKIRSLHRKNKNGDKIIEINRKSIWNDTLPHLDEHFGEFDIKIKI
jgi:hypothetical protein